MSWPAQWLPREPARGRLPLAKPRHVAWRHGLWRHQVSLLCTTAALNSWDQYLSSSYSVQLFWQIAASCDAGLLPGLLFVNKARLAFRSSDDGKHPDLPELLARTDSLLFLPVTGWLLHAASGCAWGRSHFQLGSTGLSATAHHRLILAARPRCI